MLNFPIINNIYDKLLRSTIPEASLRGISATLFLLSQKTQFSLLTPLADKSSISPEFQDIRS